MTRTPLVNRWTREEDNQLKSMIVAGRTPAEVAVKLSRSVAAVHARAYQFGLSFKRIQLRPRRGCQ
jgi:hypothetical protein